MRSISSLSEQTLRLLRATTTSKELPIVSHAEPSRTYSPANTFQTATRRTFLRPTLTQHGTLTQSIGSLTRSAGRLMARFFALYIVTRHTTRPPASTTTLKPRPESNSVCGPLVRPVTLRVPLSGLVVRLTGTVRTCRTATTMLWSRMSYVGHYVYDANH
jgi:hypothetical protein